MFIFIYNGTFEGFLTVVFEAFRLKKMPSDILLENAPLPLLYDEIIAVDADEVKAKRVWQGLQKKLSKEACRMLNYVYLSELQGIELLLFRYIKKAFESPISIETNFGDKDVLETSKIFKKVSREAERMRMFVRFRKTTDDIFFSAVEPQYNVLSLITEHFEDRFADQKWVIYDLKRGYGYYYDLTKTVEIYFDNPQFNKLTGKLDDSLMAENEKMFQHMWKNYFDSMTIKERRNPKLHKQHLPKRFWKHLPEKGGEG